MLSGIGAQFELARVGISTKVDLPGVGKNLQDHPITPLYWQSKAPLSLLNADKVGARLEYFMFRRGPLTSNVAEAGAFVRSPGAGSLPNLQYHFAPVMYLNHGLQQPEAHGFTIGATLIAPMSRGQLTLRSADPLMPPLIVGNHLSHPADRKALAYGMEFARELCAAKAFDAHRGPEHWPAFADAPSTVDSAVLDQHMRATTELLYHPVGTCRMGKDELSVVDPELRVRRVRGLSVADASVMPTITRGNTNAATLMLAERLATLIQV
jgi:choline dehydrogenase